MTHEEEAAGRGVQGQRTVSVVTGQTAPASAVDQRCNRDFTLHSSLYLPNYATDSWVRVLLPIDCGSRARNIVPPT